MKLNTLFSDRPIRVAVSAVAYLFLILAALYPNTETLAFTLLLPVIGILALWLIVRAVFVLAGKSKNIEPERNSALPVKELKYRSIRNIIEFVAYLILLAVIMGPELKQMWIIYVFISLGVISGIVTLIMPRGAADKRNPVE